MGYLKVYMVWGDKVTVEERLDLPDNRNLIAFLDSEGIEGAYATLWTSHRLSYETGERVLCAQPYDERFGGKVTPAYKDKVDAMENIAFIFHRRFSPLSSSLFEENLKALGGSYKWHNGHPRISLDGKLEVFFGPRYCRYIRIIQIGFGYKIRLVDSRNQSL